MNTRVGRKNRQFLLRDLFFGKKASDKSLISRLQVFQEESENFMKASLKDYFDHSGAEKIVMKGTLPPKQGFVLSKWNPKIIDVKKNDSIVLNKVSFYKIRNGAGQSLSVTIPHPAAPLDESKKLIITIS